MDDGAGQDGRLYVLEQARPLARARADGAGQGHDGVRVKSKNIPVVAVERLAAKVPDLCRSGEFVETAP